MNKTLISESVPPQSRDGSTVIAPLDVLGVVFAGGDAGWYLW